MRRFISLPCYIHMGSFIHYCRPLFGNIIPYKLADIGEGIKQVEVITVCVKPGDKIEEFDKICEVQSDKATVDITSRYSGVVSAVHVTPGVTALVGFPIIDIELHNNVEDSVQDVKNDTKSQENSISYNSDNKVNINGSSPSTAKSDVPNNNNNNNNTVSFTAATLSEAALKVLATPATRGFARDYGVDITRVSGSGTDGRVLKGDIRAYAEQVKINNNNNNNNNNNKEDVGDDVVIPLGTGIRRVMVTTMTEAKNIPSFTACDELELTPLLQFRDLLKDAMIAGGYDNIKLTFTPLFIKAVSLALLQHPELNAHVSSNCETLIIKRAHHIAFAIDSPKGLIVPVIRNVQHKTLMQITQEVNELIVMGRTNRITPDQLRGGTFTLSNIGSIGATYATPVLNPPQVVIGAIGRLQILPRFDKSGNIIKANISHISWTADHRVIDGASLVRFSNTFKQYLEKPGMLLADTIWKGIV